MNDEGIGLENQEFDIMKKEILRFESLTVKSQFLGTVCYQMLQDWLSDF